MCLLLACTMILSIIVTVTFAWSKDLNIINEFIGIRPKNYAVTLQKYEKDIYGELTAVPVKGAEFYLYREEGGVHTQLGGRYVTDENGRIDVTGLPPGTYYFLETDPTYAYTYDREEEADITVYPFTISQDADEGETVTVTACNRRRHSRLTVSKTVKNADGSKLKQEQKEELFEFRITFSDGGSYTCKIGEEEYTLESGGTLKLSHGQAAVFETLPVGVQYTITETPVPGYTTASTNSQGNIPVEGAAAAFINTYDESLSGRLIISKQVSGEGADPDKEFRFTVTFEDDGVYHYRINGGTVQSLESGGSLTLKHGEAAVFEYLPAGLNYTVVEDDYTSDGYIATVDKVEGTVIKGGSEAGFHNIAGNLDTGSGSLQISKQVFGTAPDLEKEFAFTVTFSDNGTYDYKVDDAETQTLESGGKILLKHGQTAVFDRLPTGITYAVTEDDYGPDGYTAGIRNVTGTIADGSVSKAAFSNYKDDEDTLLIVKKLVEGEIPGSDVEKEFHFTVIINGEETNFTLKAGEEKSFTLPVGAAYEVLENDYFPDNYIQTSMINGSGVAAREPVECRVTNTWVGTVTTDISGVKTWDTSAAPGITLPESITVYLKHGDQIVAVETVRPDSEGVWKYTFTVPKYDKQGEEILYTVDEADIGNYEKTINGYNIKNTYVSEAVMDLPVEKVVIGKPETKSRFTFTLTPVTPGAPMPAGSANGQKTAVVSGPGKISFGSIIFDTAGEYVYSIKEEKGNADGYVYDDTVYSATVRVTKNDSRLKAGVIYEKQDGSEADSPVFTNTYTKPSTSCITVRKVWAGEDPNRPSSVSVQLYKDGTAYGSPVTLSEANGWSYIWADLDDSALWTVDETNVPDGYSKLVTGDAASGFVINNIYEETPVPGEKVTVSGKKTWEHGSIDGAKKPESIIIYVKNGSKTVAQKKVTASDNWSWSISLPKYESDGLTTVNYTISEGNVPYYTAKVNGYHITNTFKGYDYPGDHPGGSPGSSPGGSPGASGYPKTGDENPVLSWIILMVVSALLLIILLAAGRRLKFWRGK